MKFKSLITEGVTIYTPHTFGILDEIKVPSGDTDFITPFFVYVPTGYSCKAVGCRYKINSGTSVTFKLQLNGVDMTGFTNLSASTTAASNFPTSVDIADGDEIALVVTAVSGTPKNFSMTLFLELDI